MDRTITLIGAIVGFVVALGGVASPILVAVIRKRNRDEDERVVAQGQTVVGYADDAIKAARELAQVYKSQADDYRARLGRANARLTDLGEPTY